MGPVASALRLTLSGTPTYVLALETIIQWLEGMLVEKA
jgi:hypothetical protein